MVNIYSTNLAEIRARVSDILARNEMIRAESQFDISGKVKWLEQTFPGMKINVVNNTYTDTTKSPPATRHLSSLQSTRYNKALKTMPQETQAKVANVVSTIINKRRDSIRNLNPNHVKTVATWMETAINLRNKRIETTLSGEFINMYDMMDSICGLYAIESSPYHFRISVDPYDVFMKSTGQYWEYTSCEKISGEYKIGPFHDIELYNAVCFVEDDAGKAYARIMIRWCDVNRSVDIGIESKWYAFPHDEIVVVNLKDERDAHEVIAPNLSGFKAYKILHGILQSKGLLQYSDKNEICTTPYKYTGFSDNMRAGGSIIRYSDYQDALIDKGNLFDKLSKSPNDARILNALEHVPGSFSEDEIVSLIRMIGRFDMAMRAIEYVWTLVKKKLSCEIMAKFSFLESTLEHTTEFAKGIITFAELIYERPGLSAAFLDEMQRVTGNRSLILHALHFVALALEYDIIIQKIDSITAVDTLMPKLFQWNGPGSMLVILERVSHVLTDPRIEMTNRNKIIMAKVATVITLLITSMIKDIFTDKTAYRAFALLAYFTIRSSLYFIKNTVEYGFLTFTPRIVLAGIAEDMFNLFVSVNTWASPLLMLVEMVNTKMHMPSLALALARKLPDSYKARDAMMTELVDRSKTIPYNSKECIRCGRSEDKNVGLVKFFMEASHDLGSGSIIFLCASCADILGMVYDSRNGITLRDADLIANEMATNIFAIVDAGYTASSGVLLAIVHILENIHFTYNTYKGLRLS